VFTNRCGFQLSSQTSISATADVAKLRAWRSVGFSRLGVGLARALADPIRNKSAASQVGKGASGRRPTRARVGAYASRLTAAECLARRYCSRN